MLVYWKADDSLCYRKCGCKIEILMENKRVCFKCGAEVFIPNSEFYNLKYLDSCVVIEDEKLERFIKYAHSL